MATQDKPNPGIKIGQSHELTVFLKLKPGGANKMRAAVDNMAEDFKRIDKLATVHDFRFVIFDNDTRLMFCSTYDGEWDAYINDFATFIPEILDAHFSEVEGWPGIHSPDVKDFIIKNQITCTSFYSAYPDATVRDIWKSLKTKSALEALLDSAT